MKTMDISRRRFLRNTGIVGGGFVVGFSLSGCSKNTPALSAIDGGFTPNAFLQVAGDAIRFYVPRDEMGQGVTTGLTTIIAEELDIDPQRIQIELAGAHSDYSNPEFGAQGTGGSTSIKAHFAQLREVGANVRATLLQAAAQELGQPVDTFTTDDGHIISGDQRTPYTEFAAAASKLAIVEDAPLKAPSDFKYIGKQAPRLDGLVKSTGTAVYGIDIDVPNMHHAVVVRSPVSGGTLKTIDASTAETMPGVTDIVPIASGVAVVADKYWQAKQAAQKLELEWDLPELANISTAQLQADYRDALANKAADTASSGGDFADAITNSSVTVESQYWAPYLAHAPMEPMSCVVRVANGEADVWAGTQGPGIAQALVARYADLDVDKVRSHQTYLGGAFGRRALLSHVIEATQVAVASKKPIHLLWSREDDIKDGVYRPASLMQVKAGLDKNGKINAWQATRVGGNIAPATLNAMLPGALPSLSEGVVDWLVNVADSVLDGWVVDPTSVEGFAEDYDTPNHQVLHITRDHGLPLLFWRSVGHSYSAFAKEVAVDELATAADMDAIELRLNNTQDNPRLNQVIKLAAQKMTAMRAANKDPKRGFGFAAHKSFDTYVAEVAEVSIDNGNIRVHSVACVVDCGVVVNPDVVAAQMEGSVMYGLTAALHGNLDLENGAVKQSNFHDYPILRMNEAPKVEVVIVESKDAPTGVGEPGLPPIAPAVANAVFELTGERLRSLPLRMS